MNGEEYKDLQTIVPLINTAASAGNAARFRSAAIDVTAVSAVINLLTYFPELTPGGAHDGQYFDFTADGGNIYLFANNANGGTVDSAARTAGGATVAGGVLFNGQTKPWRIPSGYTYLVVQGSGACVLRIALSSTAYGQDVGGKTGNA